MSKCLGFKKTGYSHGLKSLDFGDKSKIHPEAKILWHSEVCSFLAVFWSKMDPKGPRTQSFGIEGLFINVPSYPRRS